MWPTFVGNSSDQLWLWQTQAWLQAIWTDNFEPVMFTNAVPEARLWAFLFTEKMQIRKLPYFKDQCLYLQRDALKQSSTVSHQDFEKYFLGKMKSFKIEQKDLKGMASFILQSMLSSLEVDPYEVVVETAACCQKTGQQFSLIQNDLLRYESEWSGNTSNPLAQLIDTALLQFKERFSHGVTFERQLCRKAFSKFVQQMRHGLALGSNLKCDRASHLHLLQLCDELYSIAPI